MSKQKTSPHDERVKNILECYVGRYEEIPNNVEKIKNEKILGQYFEHENYIFIYIPLETCTDINDKVINDILTHCKNETMLILITFDENTNWYLWKYYQKLDQLVLTNSEDCENKKKFEEYQEEQFKIYFELYNNKDYKNISLYLPQHVENKIALKRDDIKISNIDFSTEMKYYWLWFAFERFAREKIRTIEWKKIIGECEKAGTLPLKKETIENEKRDLDANKLLVLFKFIWNKIHTTNKKIRPCHICCNEQKKHYANNPIIWINGGGAFNQLRVCANLRHSKIKFYLSKETLKVILIFFHKNNILQDTIFNFPKSLKPNELLNSFYKFNF